MHPETCVFCQERPANSDEHIYRKTYRRFAGENSYSQIDFNTGVVRKLSPGETSFNQKVKVVCSHCNNGWMNNLDKQVQPAAVALFKGNPYSCDETMSAALALWAAKTTMMRVFKDPDRSVRDHEMKYLHDNREPPPGWSVFLGHTTSVGSTNESRWNWYSLDKPDPLDSDVTVKPSGLVVPNFGRGYFQQHAVAIQQMLLITFGVSGPDALPGKMRWADALNGMIGSLRIQTPAPVIQLWPSPTAFEWPSQLPTHPIGDFVPLLQALPIIASGIPGPGSSPPGGGRSVF